MKTKTFAIMLMAAGIMMSACNSKQKSDGKTVDSDSTNVAVAQPDDEEAAPERGIATIKKEWKGKTLKVEAGEKLDINQLTLAFCAAFPQCETNKALYQYLSQPENASKESYQIEMKYPGYDVPIAYHINNNARNGFIRCMGEVETDRFTYACYWNRPNGHKLFAAYMEECWESTDWDQCLIVFYDYDPANATMTPEPALTEMIEKRMKDYNCYYINLPEEGKDITITGVESEEEDAYASEDFKLKWNGTSFDWSE